jgi:hypothetical protein
MAVPGAAVADTAGQRMRYGGLVPMMLMSFVLVTAELLTNRGFTPPTASASS